MTRRIVVVPDDAGWGGSVPPRSRYKGRGPVHQRQRKDQTFMPLPHVYRDDVAKTEMASALQLNLDTMTTIDDYN